MLTENDLIMAANELEGLGRIFCFHQAHSIMPGEVGTTFREHPELKAGSFKIMESKEGFMVFVHGAKDGSVDFEGGIKGLAQTVTACLGKGKKVFLVSCFNGNREDYKDENIELIRTPGTT